MRSTDRGGRAANGKRDGHGGGGAGSSTARGGGQGAAHNDERGRVRRGNIFGGGARDVGGRARAGALSVQYVDSEEEEDKLSSLAQQPEVAEEAASDTGVMDGRGKDEVEGRVDVHEVVQHCFNFPSKRERKLSDEEQQEEAKRPKSPEREGVQLAEQHGSGGEGGEQMETDMREIPLGVGFGFGSGSTRPYVFRPLGSAPAPTAL